MLAKTKLIVITYRESISKFGSRAGSYFDFRCVSRPRVYEGSEGESGATNKIEPPIQGLFPKLHIISNDLNYFSYCGVAVPKTNSL